jgi:glutamine amidotransferase
MCRILYARAEADFAISELLAPFAELSRHSSEFQGHGWGCAWREGGSWRHYHDIRPIWEDDLSQFENNMPFSDGESVFIFNGELRGVRIRSEGRIGAEKIYNYIRRFDKGDKCAATAKAVDIIKKRSTYVRAMNLILSDGAQSCLSTNYSENTGYFQMHQKQDGGLHLVCSEPFAGDRGWTRIENNTTIAL